MVKIPKVARKLSKNGPRRFRKSNPAALDSQLTLVSITKKLGAGGPRAAKQIEIDSHTAGVELGDDK